MKTLLAALLVVLSGCQTVVRDKNGVPRFRTFADIQNFRYKDESTVITANLVDHSTPTKAGTNGIADGITAGAAAGLIGVAR
jgi:hypothetical protein